MAETRTLSIHKGKEAEIEIGGLRFRACRREIEDIDGGVTLQVFGEDAGAEAELLRFDCFRKAPHYHAPGENTQETKLDAEAVGDGRQWVFEQLSNNLHALLEQAGFSRLSENLELDAFSDAVPRLSELVDALAEPTETSTFEIPADTPVLGGN